MSKIQNPFFVIEALDAGGSQTQTDLLGAKLKEESYGVHQYHFPQEDTATGRLIYDKFLLHLNQHPFSRREQAILFIQDFFSRLDEMKRLQSEKAKQVIISDRYCTSTMAYQTIGLSGKKRRELLAWMSWLCWEGQPKLLKPNAVIFLDTPVNVSLERLKGKKKDYFESKTKLMNIRRSYTMLAKDQRWVVINSMDGTKQRTREDIHEEIWTHIQKKLR